MVTRNTCQDRGVGCTIDTRKLFQIRISFINKRYMSVCLYFIIVTIMQFLFLSIYIIKHSVPSPLRLHDFYNISIIIYITQKQQNKICNNLFHFIANQYKLCTSIDNMKQQVYHLVDTRGTTQSCISCTINTLGGTADSGYYFVFIVLINYTILSFLDTTKSQLNL